MEAQGKAALSIAAPIAVSAIARAAHAALLAIGALIVDWHDRREGRHALLRLTDRELRDIGVSPGEAVSEASKPFWRT